MNNQSTAWQRKKMVLRTYLPSVLAILLIFVCLGQLPSPISQPIKAATRGASPITHIVIMVKENRTFDDLFGTFLGADGATTYKDPKGKIHPLNHQLDTVQDMDHSYSAFQTAYDNGKMDGFSRIYNAIQLEGGIRVDVADSQLYQSDIPNYWQYAKTFTLPDHFFYTIRGPSFPNHLFSIAATDDDVNDNPINNIGKESQRWGCDSLPGTTVHELHANGTESTVFPCFTFPTLGDLLTSHGISWKYYSVGQDKSGYEWSIYNAIKDIRTTSQWQTHVVDYTQFAKDAANGTLPTVSWLVQPTNVSDHPNTSICAGENFTVQQINAIMGNHALWQSTAIFLTWDDFGGFYDHYKPSQGPNGLIEYGFRAPMLVISPYAKPHFIDNTFYTLPSVLKFAETVLGLPSLGGLDKQANDMFNAFNFNQKPLPPLILKLRTCPPGSNKVYPSIGPS